MRTGQRLGVLVACGVAVLVAAYVAGSEGGGRTDPPRPSVGSVRLGPDSGEPVADYLARIPADLPAPGTTALALVQFGGELTTGAALDAVEGAAPVVAVLRVPLPRVQTALRFETLPPSVTALETARQRAADSAADDASRTGGRRHAVAQVEEAALAEPGCACVLALVVRADRSALAALGTRPGVRAVQAAPAGVGPTELALAPLLPEQTERADPPPDDGEVSRP